MKVLQELFGNGAEDLYTVPDNQTFMQLIERVRLGDGEAALQLVEQYESSIRVAIRTRLFDPRLRAQFDSMDVCQSVLGSFFIGVAAGRYELHEPIQLVALLTKMAQNKVAMRARAQSRQRRDIDRTVQLDETVEICHRRFADGFDPVRHAIGRELLEKVYDMMTPEIRRMADLRTQETTWSGIAQIMGGMPEARRKQYQRAIDRISQIMESEQAESRP